LVPDAHFDAGVILLPAQVRLAGVDTGNQRVAKARGVAQRVTDGSDGPIGAGALLPLRRSHHGIARIEVHPQPSERPGQDAGELRVYAFGVHAGGQIRLDANGERRQHQRFRVEVVEDPQVQIAGLVRAHVGTRVGKQIALDFDLRIGEGAVDDLRLKRHLRAAFSAVVEPHAALQADLPFRNGISILHSDRTVGIEVVMVQGNYRRGRDRQDYAEQERKESRISQLQW